MSRNSKRSSPITRARKFAAKLKAKDIKIAAKTAHREVKRQANLKRGGIRGALARARDRVLVKHDVKNEMDLMKPELFKQKNKTTIETEAAVKRTKAKGQALAAAASALGGSYATAKGFDAEAEKAKAEANEAGSKALQAQLDSIPNISSPTPDQGSISGLVTGVR